MCDKVEIQLELYLQSYIAQRKKDNLWEKLPLVIFKTLHADYIHDVLRDHHITIQRQITRYDDIVNCKHYPYTCNEVSLEHHSSDAYLTQCHEQCMCRCDSSPLDFHGQPARCYCDIEVENSRSYVQFSWNDQYMEFNGSCQDDCCIEVKVHQRHLIWLSSH
jgi:hypothetical protein